MTTLRPCRARGGFTLIELLTVIAIIGILAAIIIPTVGRVRQSARDASCKSNLRQIGMAVHIYANETGYYPPSRTLANDPIHPNFLWRQMLRSYMGSNGDIAKKNNELLNSQIVVCPSRTLIPVDEATNIRPTYAAHSLVMPDLQEVSPTARIRFGSLMRPSHVILMADSTQQTTGGSHSNIWSVSALRTSGSAAAADTPIPVTNDQDPEAGGYIRYRHGDNGSTNTVFVDGHVAAFKKGEILERHVKINY